MRRAVIFDRDDTLIRRKGGAPTGDLGHPDHVELLPAVPDALRRLHEGGFFLAVVTNQGGVARGAYDEPDVFAVHDRLNALLRDAGAPPIEAFRFCPFHPRGVVPEFTREHPWRKPAPGMILDLAREHAIDLPASWVVGDQARDIAAAKAAGCRAILIAPPGKACDPAPEATLPDVLEAALHILAAPTRAS